MIILTRPVIEEPQVPSVTITYPPDVEVAPLSWRWTAAGDSWELTDWSSPVIKLSGAQVDGMAMPEHFWTDNPVLDGSTWEGMRFSRGQTFMPVMVRAASSLEYLQEFRRFVRTLNPRIEGKLRCTWPEGTWREVGCRYEDGLRLTFDKDPVKLRRSRHGITWANADPLWSGEPVVKVIPVANEIVPLFPGPPFGINERDVIGSAQVDNPGDEPAHPVWRIDGPFTQFSVGIGSAVTTVPVSRQAGEWVEINMHPHELTVTNNQGLDIAGLATNLNFVAIPPGARVDLIAAMSGTVPGVSQATLTFTPRFWGPMT